VISKYDIDLILNSFDDAHMMKGMLTWRDTYLLAPDQFFIAYRTIGMF